MATPRSGDGDSLQSGVDLVKFAYADPPYLGCCKLYEHFHGDDGRCWDEPDTHRLLIDHLSETFPDGWAMSASSPSLRALLPLCPDDVRVAAWVKPFAVFKPNVNPAYTWEPVIYRGGRNRDRTEPTAKDHLIESITLRKGLTGAKPRRFGFWVFGLLGAEPTDKLVDLFIGTGAVSEAWGDFCGRPRPVQEGMLG